MKVWAAIAEGNGTPFELAEVDLDAPAEDEVLVRIAAGGICHTDIVAQAGGFGFGIPAVLGHEGAGTIEAMGAAVTGFAVGDRVIITFRSCGACSNCCEGHPAYCLHLPELNYTGMRVDGSRTLHRDGTELASNFFGQSSFATHALTYARNLVKLDDDIPLDVAAPIGCGVQTGAGSIFNVLKPSAGSSLLVTGGGAVGLSAVMAAAISGCNPIIVAEPHASRRALALELGATHVIDPLTADLPAAVRQIVTAGVDYAFDTTGRTEVLSVIMEALAICGTLGCVGIGAPGTALPGDLNRVMTLGQTVTGIIEGDSNPTIFVPRLLQLYRDGKFPIDKLIQLYPLDRINDAVADQHAGSCVKAVLTFG